MKRMNESVDWLIVFRHNEIKTNIKIHKSTTNQILVFVFEKGECTCEI